MYRPTTHEWWWVVTHLDHGCTHVLDTCSLKKHDDTWWQPRFFVFLGRKKPHFWSPWRPVLGQNQRGYCKTLFYSDLPRILCEGSSPNTKKPRILVIFRDFPGFVMFFWSKNTIFMDDWRPVSFQNQRRSSKTLFYSDLSWILYTSTEWPPKIHNFWSKSVFGHFFTK